MLYSFCYQCLLLSSIIEISDSAYKNAHIWDLAIATPMYKNPIESWKGIDCYGFVDENSLYSADWFSYWAKLALPIEFHFLLKFSCVYRWTYSLTSLAGFTCMSFCSAEFSSSVCIWRNMFSSFMWMQSITFCYSCLQNSFILLCKYNI